MTMLHDPKRLGRPKISIGARTRRRPMTPAEAIKEFADETGEPIDRIARRLGVRTDTCRTFLSILDLAEDWHFGQADSSGCPPFSMAAGWAVSSRAACSPGMISTC